MDLPPETVYLPFEEGTFRMAMGLASCDPSALIELDDRYPEEMAERRALLASRRAEVFAACPGSEHARAEVLARFATILPASHPVHFAREGTVLRNQLTGEQWDVAELPCDPLEVAGRLVQEDLCVIGLTRDGPVLTAGVVCFPSRWRLAEKIGRPLLDVHATVPLYAERLGRPVDRFMAHVQPGRLAVRFNWSVLDDGALFQVSGKGRTARDPAITAENAGERLFLRVERQTLSRLPESGAVLFTIRVHRYAVARVAVLPGAAARLAAAVRAMPEVMAAYKSLPAFRAALLDYLDARDPDRLTAHQGRPDRGM